MKYIKTILNFTGLFMASGFAVALATPLETENELQRPTHVIMTSQISPEQVEWLEMSWQIGDITFVDARQNVLPFNRNSIKNGELLPLGRFCVTGEVFPPRGYDPLLDMGFYGEDGICGPFAQGSDRLIENPYTAHSDGKWRIRYNYRELFVDSTGNFWFGMQVFLRRTFMRNKVTPGKPVAFKNVIGDFVASRDMTVADFTRGLEESLSAQRFSAVLKNYPDLSKALKGASEL